MNLSRKFFRTYLKRFYAVQKKKERTTGFKINNLVQAFHHEICKKQKLNHNDEKNKDVIQFIENNLKLILKDIKELREQPSFKRDFPTFRSFCKYVRKEKLTKRDLEEL